MTGGEDEREAVGRLFARYGDDIYRYVRFSLGQPAEAEDVVQDVFLEALRSCGSFRGESSEKTWLWSIARHRTVDRIRRRGRERAVVPVDLKQFADPTAPDSDTVIDLERSLQHLSDDQRQAVILKVVQDKSAAEVADILGWSNVKVRVTLHRALRVLSRLLGTETLTEGGAGEHGR